MTTKIFQGHEIIATLATIPLAGDRAVYVWPMATNRIDDRMDRTNCDACGRTFGYAKRGYNPINKDVRHMFDCENPNNW